MTTADLFGATWRAEELKADWFTGAFVAPWLRIVELPRGQACIWAYDVGDKWKARLSPAGPYQEVEPQEGETREAAALALIEAAERAA